MADLTRSPKQIGNIFCRARKQRGWSQTQLGERAGLRQETISLIETSNPATRIDTILAVLAAEIRANEHRGAAGLARAAREMLTSHGDHLIRSLPTIAVPTLVLVGSEDTNFLAATDYMARKIPNATKVVIDGAGHAANLDAPAPFNRAVEAFLTGLAA